jgi:transposase-like protein
MQPQNYSGVLLVDGKYLPVKKVKGKREGLIPKSGKRRGKTKKGLVEIAFMDYGTHDIPIHIVAYSENMYEIEKGFLELKETGYPLKVIVCDESMGDIVQVAKKVYPNVIVQLCLTHYSKNIDRAFKVNFAKRKIKSLQRELERIGKSFMIPTRHHDIRKAIRIVNEIGELQFEYGYLIEVQEILQEIFWRVNTMEELEEAEKLLDTTISYMQLKNYPHTKAIKDRYDDYYRKRDLIIASIKYPKLDIPRTTNLIEGFNSTTLEIRLTSIRGFEDEKYAEDYINAIILDRRFKSFKDCKGKFKHLNKKSPLEIANPKNTFNYNFHSSDWIQFCLFMKKRY